MELIKNAKELVNKVNETLPEVRQMLNGDAKQLIQKYNEVADEVNETLRFLRKKLTYLFGFASVGMIVCIVLGIQKILL